MIWLHSTFWYEQILILVTYLQFYIPPIPHCLGSDMVKIQLHLNINQSFIVDDVL